jgi:hypothetical protein
MCGSGYGSAAATGPGLVILGDVDLEPSYGSLVDIPIEIPNIPTEDPGGCDIPTPVDMDTGWTGGNETGASVVGRLGHVLHALDGRHRQRGQLLVKDVHRRDAGRGRNLVSDGDDQRARRGAVPPDR